MDEAVYSLAHLWKLYDFSNLLSTHVIEALPSELFLLFKLSKNVLVDSFELS